MVGSKRTYGYTTRTTYRSQLNMGGTYMVKKIERICIVYDNKKTMEFFLRNSGIWWDDKELNLIEINPATEHFQELKHGLLKGFKE